VKGLQFLKQLFPGLPARKGQTWRRELHNRKKRRRNETAASS